MQHSVVMRIQFILEMFEKCTAICQRSRQQQNSTRNPVRLACSFSVKDQKISESSFDDFSSSKTKENFPMGLKAESNEKIRQLVTFKCTFLLKGM